MKAKIIATGEIINISEYAKVILNRCDSFGDPIQLPFDEVEFISEPTTEEPKESSEYLVNPSDMPSEERMRYELAKAAIPTAWSVCLKYDYSTRKYSHIGDEDIAKESLDIADAIIKQLKESEATK